MVSGQAFYYFPKALLYFLFLFLSLIRFGLVNMNTNRLWLAGLMS